MDRRAGPGVQPRHGGPNRSQPRLGGRQPEAQVDVATFIAWVDARAQNESELTAFYRARFRDEFKPAFAAWLATKPFENPDAPPTPFAMPRVPAEIVGRGRASGADGGRRSELAKEANERADNYMLAVVLFASSLFFAGISTKLQTVRARTAILGLGCVLFVGTVIWVADVPDPPDDLARSDTSTRRAFLTLVTRKLDPDVAIDLRDWLRDECAEYELDLERHSSRAHFLPLPKEPAAGLEDRRGTERSYPDLETCGRVRPGGLGHRNGDNAANTVAFARGLKPVTGSPGADTASAGALKRSSNCAASSFGAEQKVDLEEPLQAPGLEVAGSGEQLLAVAHERLRVQHRRVPEDAHAGVEQLRVVELLRRGAGPVVRVRRHEEPHADAAPRGRAPSG